MSDAKKVKSTNTINTFYRKKTLVSSQKEHNLTTRGVGATSNIVVSEMHSGMLNPHRVRRVTMKIKSRSKKEPPTI